MELRSSRRDVVAWRQSAVIASWSRTPRPGRVSRIRRWIRIAVLLAVVAMINAARAARSNWPEVAGSVLVVGGITLHGGAGGVLVLAGAVCLLCGGVLPPKARPGLTPIPGPRTTGRR